MTNTPILYVEDEDTDTFLVRTAFEDAGIINPLQVVTDGRKAINYLVGAGPFSDRGKYPLPGLVLLDLKLPKESGLDVLEWIRRQPEFRSLVVIVLTSSPDPGDAQRAYELGANSYVIKPSQILRLSELARCLKCWWLGWNQFVPDS